MLMAKRVRLSLMGLLLLLGMVACSGLERSVPENAGMNIPIDPAFTEFYYSYGGGAVFGQPLTSLFEFEGKQVQYFQRMRLELDRDNRVLVSPLGAMLYQPTASPNSDVELTSPAIFQSFYEQHGAELVFGSAISPLQNEGNRLVQYFQNGLLEWQPAAPVGQQVQVGELGNLHFIVTGADWAYEKVLGLNAGTNTTLSHATVEATVRHPILFSHQIQQIYVEARTPEHRVAGNYPVQIRLAGSESLLLAEGTTDDSGVVMVEIIEMPAFSAGQYVALDILILSRQKDTILGSKRIIFRQWW